MRLSKIQKRHYKWVKRNFGKPPAYQPLLGAVEELGELAHSHIKGESGIRGSADEHIAGGQDAIGDILLFLMQYCSRQGWDMQEILEATTREVWKRDWKEYPVTGRSPELEDTDGR
jgi:NTP pyrophosphatase (non-canonical NTP hydrolase)